MCFQKLTKPTLCSWCMFFVMYCFNVQLLWPLSPARCGFRLSMDELAILHMCLLWIQSMKIIIELQVSDSSIQPVPNKTIWLNANLRPPIQSQISLVMATWKGFWFLSFSSQIGPKVGGLPWHVNKATDRKEIWNYFGKSRQTEWAKWNFNEFPISPVSKMIH